MKLSDYITKKAALAAKTGEVQADDYVLAVDCATGEVPAEVGDYEVAAVHVENTGATISANTTDKNYLYEGATTLRSGARRNFSVAGQRFAGDGYQDYVCSHAVAFGVGAAVVRPYVYLNMATLKGERGNVTINVTNDGSGASGNMADFAVTMVSVGTPAEYAYSPISPAT